MGGFPERRWVGEERRGPRGRRRNVTISIGAVSDIDLCYERFYGMEDLGGLGFNTVNID